MNNNTEIKIDENGTKYYQDLNTFKLVFSCQYCDSWFETNRKFNQKYCSNSCKTMASKERSNIKSLIKKMALFYTIYNNNEKTIYMEQIEKIHSEIIDTNLSFEEIENYIKDDNEIKAKYISIKDYL